MTNKICVRCKLLKKYHAFGLCVQCYHIEYTKKNREHLKKISLNHFYKNKEKYNNRSLEYYYSHREYCIKKKREYRLLNKEKIKRYNQLDYVKKKRNIYQKKRYYPKNKLKYQAHTFVFRLIQKGKLLPLINLKCKNCNLDAKDYHHYLGYEKKHWGDVIPLCRICHIKENKK